MKPSERRKARHCATQAIYQWQMTQANVGDIEEQFKIDQDTKGVDLNYFRDLLFGVAVHCNELDKVFAPFLSPSAGRSGHGGQGDPASGDLRADPS